MGASSSVPVFRPCAGFFDENHLSASFSAIFWADVSEAGFLPDDVDQWLTCWQASDECLVGDRRMSASKFAHQTSKSEKAVIRGEESL